MILQTSPLLPEITCKRGHLRDRWILKCSECAKVFRVQWRDANPGKARASLSRWRDAHPERVRAINKRWRDANPGKEWPRSVFHDKASACNYLARQAGVRGKITGRQLEALYGACALCCLQLGEDWHVAYKIPLSNFIENVWLVCGDCNKIISLVEIR